MEALPSASHLLLQYFRSSSEREAHWLGCTPQLWQPMSCDCAQLALATQCVDFRCHLWRLKRSDPGLPWQHTAAWSRRIKLALYHTVAERAERRWRAWVRALIGACAIDAGFTGNLFLGAGMNEKTVSGSIILRPGMRARVSSRLAMLLHRRRVSRSSGSLRQTAFHARPCGNSCSTTVAPAGL